MGDIVGRLTTHTTPFVIYDAVLAVGYITTQVYIPFFRPEAMDNDWIMTLRDLFYHSTHGRHARIAVSNINNALRQPPSSIILPTYDVLLYGKRYYINAIWTIGNSSTSFAPPSLPPSLTPWGLTECPARAASGKRRSDFPTLNWLNGQATRWFGDETSMWMDRGMAGRTRHAGQRRGWWTGPWMEVAMDVICLPRMALWAIMQLNFYRRGRRLEREEAQPRLQQERIEPVA
ncbi:hypothetical protein GGTG_11890 [Gaeumannomyces tritici R3-111a-1]|uniref:Uncharacterized protein n=1 Tax=Gaeumannomyces tritici (strain R3-111a-1) TaxID=644352 RepID=J3PEF9_GAET3|nr:hypothetical protein GGTG_11890 [Gaeumannomyces tritici R3-111a-1]EJT70867.1 hypothetical protein GGTG_11890 [Gaeumannomyces tritici R3-111a-1]